MPRENSFSDSDGRSLTPDLSDENDFDMGPGSLTTSPVAENLSTAQSRFDYPPTNLQPAMNGNGTAPPSASPDPQPVAPAAMPSRRSTNATVYSTNGMPPKPPLERFRASVRKVIHMKRGSSAMTLGGAGAEPGVDPRRSSANVNYAHLIAKCTIDVVDYNAVSILARERKDNDWFLKEFMYDEKKGARQHWVKVRWINIGGINWEVIKAIALAYDLHPLVIEDIVQPRQRTRSKADYYLKHLFIRVLKHTLSEEEEDFNPSITQLPRSASPESIREHVHESIPEEDETEEGQSGKEIGEPDEDKTLAGSRFSTKKKAGLFRKASAAQDVEKGLVPERGRPFSPSTLMRRKRMAERQLIQHLRRGERVNVKVEPFFIFLFRDGTVISINSTPEHDFTAPILARLKQRDTSLRTTADPSLLVESLLDLVVDRAMEVVDEYQNKILKLEHDVLIRPSMKTVRWLHLMSGDITLHKRTLEPIKTLVYGLRRYDIDRCAALVNAQGMDVSKVQGYMTHKSKIYLADVYDHIDYIIGSLDMFSTIAENLINYTFNMASYEMNNVMRRLTLATIIFLPLTLLTGYFGMNFDPMWSVQQNSDLLFWKIALPVMAVVVPLFMWDDIKNGVHYAKKRWMDRTLRKNLHDVKKKQ